MYNANANDGILFVNTIDSFGNLKDKQPFFDYANLGRFRSIEKTSDGGYILGATMNKLSDRTQIVSYGKFYLLKLDANFCFVWSRQFNSIIPYDCVSASQTSDGGYVMSGFEHTGNYHYTMVMIKTDPFGNIVKM